VGRTDRPMNIAVIGRGRCCGAFLEMQDARRFLQLKARIVALADFDDNAAGIRLVRAKGTPTTRDNHDFFSLQDLDLIMVPTAMRRSLKTFCSTGLRGCASLR
jgi:hypothetical protein